jgi:diacylglycerol kinase (ATP)
LNYDLVTTEAPWDAARLAEQAVADGYDVVVSVGGDGTANEVLNGLMLAREAGIGTATMGVIPIGRGNDFAYGTGVPTGFEAACQNLVDGEASWIDIGIIRGGLYPKGRYFGNGVGIGFDAVVGFLAAEMKLTGFMAYLASALKAMYMYFKAATIELQMDDATITQPALMVSTMNGRRMGGGFMMAPNSLRDDALFDLCIVDQVSRPHMLALMLKFIKGTQGSDAAVHFHHSRHVHVKAVLGTLPAHADGETICTHGEELDIELLPAQIKLICKPQELLK